MLWGSSVGTAMPYVEKSKGFPNKMGFPSTAPRCIGRNSFSLCQFIH